MSERRPPTGVYEPVETRGAAMLSRDRATYVRLATSATIVLVAGFCVALGAARVAPGWIVALAALAVPLAAGCARTWVRSRPWCRRARPLARLPADDPAVTGMTTLIAVPALVPSPARARELVEKLSALGAAHPEHQFRFALLTDFADADAQRTPDDDAILRALEERIGDLNAATGGGSRFAVLHRRRCWSATQQRWIGWERKRGKILELLRLLDIGQPTSFDWCFGGGRELREAGSISCVIVVDDGTWMPAGSALQLVRVAAHPLNRPAIDVRSRRVLAGYGIVQPRIHFLAASEEEAPMSAARRSPQGFASASFQFRVLDVGMHMGAAALYNVGACRLALDGAFPVEQVLQHDMLDGFVARTLEAADVLALQRWPSTFLGQSRRGQRWLRGLFQAAPWLLPTTPGAAGRGPNPLSGVQRYILAEVLLAELTKPAAALLMIAAWTILPGPALLTLLWTILACPPLALELTRFTRSVVGAARRGGARAPRGTPGALGRAAFSTAFVLTVLAYECVVVIDVACRVLWRMAVSRRHLLDWTTRQAHADARTSRAGYWPAMWASPALGIATLAAVAMTDARRLYVAAPFLLAWSLAPALVLLADRYVFGAQADAS